MKIDITSHPDNAKIAEMMVSTMRFMKIKPTRHVIAEAGKDFGEVSNWIIGDELNLVEVKDNSTTSYQITEWEPDMLLEFLIDESIKGNDRVLHLANIFGIEDAMAMTKSEAKDSDEPCMIMKTIHYYQGNTTVKISAYISGGHGTHLVYKQSEALDWILSENTRQVTLLTYQVSRPRYEMIKIL